MQKYPLAKLIQWAGERGLPGRKRLQKVVFFLQAAGCPFGAEFILHHYGPYSRDVAEGCDELAQADLVEEELEGGGSYSYRVLPAGSAALSHSEQKHGDLAATVSRFEALAKDLIATDLWELELGATILFFRLRCNEWDAATAQACKFKGIEPRTNSTVPRAEAL